MVSAPTQAATLAALEAQIAVRDQPTELLALATAIDDFGRQLALELGALAGQPALAAPLVPVMMQVPPIHTRALLRAAEKLDDAGSPRRAARVLITALDKALDANMVSVVVDALGFIFDAFGQTAASARLRELLVAPAETANRRAIRARYHAIVELLADLVDWNALDDELGFD